LGRERPDYNRGPAGAASDNRRADAPSQEAVSTGNARRDVYVASGPYCLR
jgi:hypothetical protein